MAAKATMMQVIEFCVEMYLVLPAFFLHLPKMMSTREINAQIRYGKYKMPKSLIVISTHDVFSALRR